MNIDEIRARAEAATPAPWRCINAYGSYIRDKDGRNIGLNYRVNDAEFIAHAREDIPLLLDALEAKERECKDEFDIATGYYNKWQKAESENADLRAQLAAADICNGCNYVDTVGCRCGRAKWRGKGADNG